MNKNGQVTLGVLFILFLGVIVAIAMMPQIANSQSNLVNKEVIVDEVYDFTAIMNLSGQVNTTAANHTVTNAPTGWKIDSCPLTDIVVTNSTGDAWTANTDYIFVASTGTIAILNTANTNSTATGGSNSSLIDYTWCPDGYIPDGAGRSMAGLIMVFVALGLFAFVLSYAVKGYFK